MHQFPFSDCYICYNPVPEHGFCPREETSFVIEDDTFLTGYAYTAYYIYTCAKEGQINIYINFNCSFKAGHIVNMV